MKLSIVIPFWNGAEKAKKHLPKVIEAAKYSKVFEIIATDDASSDDTVEVIRQSFPEVKLVKREINGGFSSNVNFGIKHAEGDLIVLLNSDASPKENFLDAAIPHFKDSKVFSVGCNVGGLWATGRFEKGFFWHGQGVLKQNEEPQAHRTLWASGGSAVFRRQIWDELHGLDEMYNPFYEEDVDLGYRATKRGYINLWEPNSVVEHYHEKGVIATHFSQKTISGTAQRNQLLFIWKNITSEQLFNQHIIALARMLLVHPKYLKIFISAWKRRHLALKGRQAEKRDFKLTDEEVFALFR